MKKRYIFMIAICAILSLLVSCDGSINGMFFEHKVTFDYDNGGPAVVKEVKHGETVNKPEDPTKDGYAFVNWTTDKEGKKEYDFATPVTGNITLYAQWDKLYKVTFELGGGTLADLKDQTVIEGKYATNPGSPIKANYTFVAWYDGDEKFDFENTKIEKDYDLTAKWGYKVTFNSNGGTGDVPQQVVVEGEKAVKPTTIPTQVGWGLLGWTTNTAATDADYFNFESSTIKSDTSLYAIWKKSYTVGDKGPTGGWIFYDVDADNNSGNNDNLKSEECGWRYLETTEKDYKDSSWGSDGSTLDTKAEIGEGKSNTKALLDAIASYPAAEACANYGEGTEYNDWFLPSKDELRVMIKNLYEEGNNKYSFTNMTYWSSTAASTNTAWGEYPGSSTGSTQFTYKTTTSGTTLRPVRRF